MAQAYRENVNLALDTLRTHKLRSFLTVLGVVIGVGVIMLVAALLAGFDENVTEAITGYGADTAFVSRFDQGPHIGRRPKEERLRKDAQSTPRQGARPVPFAEQDAQRQHHGCRKHR